MKTKKFLVTFVLFICTHCESQTLDSAACLKNMFLLKATEKTNKNKYSILLLKYRQKDSVYITLSEKLKDIIKQKEYHLYRQGKIMSSLKAPDSINSETTVVDTLITELSITIRKTLLKQKKLKSVEVYDKDNFVIARIEYLNKDGCDFQFADGPVDGKYLHYTDETYGQYRQKLITGNYILVENYPASYSKVIPVINRGKIVGFLNFTYKN